MNKIGITIVIAIFAIAIAYIYNDNKGETPNVEVKEFYYKGHSYLYMNKGTDYGYIILHNPDCKKCGKR